MEQTNVEQKVKPKRARRKRSARKVRKGPLSPFFYEIWKDRPAWMALVMSMKTKDDTRAGIPDGMRKPQAMKLRAKAGKKAIFIMDELENAGVVAFDLDIAEEAMARKALLEALTIALSPGRAQEKNTAIRTVLEWTKAKPATKTDLRLNNAEAWLAEVVDDHRKANDAKPV